MRKIIGWQFVIGDNWEISGRRMKHRLQRHTDQLGIKPWSVQVKDRKSKVLVGLTEEHYWMYQAIRWYPPSCGNVNLFQCVRARGHPHTKWDDGIKRY